MAEIKIEKKKPIWPWILLVLILLAVIAYFVYANNEDDGYSNDMETEQVDDVNSNTFNDSTEYEDKAEYSNSPNIMMQYSESIKDSTRIGKDSTYTKTALQNLSKAVTAKAAQYNLENSKALEDLKHYSGEMDGMSDSNTTNTAGVSKNFKMVSGNIVSILESIQIKNFPELQKEMSDFKQSSIKITTTVLEKQQSTLQAFFRKAHEVLNKMNS